MQDNVSSDNKARGKKAKQKTLIFIRGEYKYLAIAEAALKTMLNYTHHE